MRTVEVVAAIIRRGSCVLATQRDKGELAGGWEFPGGKVELGETCEQALRREIREELDAEVRVERFFQTVEWEEGDFRRVMHCYVCSLPDGHFELLEHRAARWLHRDELDEVAWLPADEEILEALKEALSDRFEEPSCGRAEIAVEDGANRRRAGQGSEADAVIEPWRRTGRR